ncbi:MAG: 4-hydroxythreonine-4-phosphate dehydrogenase PdxA [Pseudomonadota bacterium]|nr:4-hydroxythreonine-4-phosphate dehydrogenase PdxA [Pseudomonadota bacterium]
MTIDNSPILAISMGEPAGIGGEITLKAWTQSKSLYPFFIIDDPERLRIISKKIKVKVPIQSINSPSETVNIFSKALPVLPIDTVSPLQSPVIPGKPDAANSKAVIASIEFAIKLIMEGEADAIITNPIHKDILYKSGFQFPGHTEFLASLAGIKSTPIMMLATDNLKVVPVTIHQSLRDAIETLDIEKIIEAGIVTNNALKKNFGLVHPRLAVAGLNPHAGENNSMGNEESLIIEPAVKALSKMGIDVYGPVSPDTLFTKKSREKFDAAICMYHDQALIPIKAIAFQEAVNITLGLPFIRTSPDHGTAFDIANTGKADESNLIAAIKMAGDICKLSKK